MGINSDPNSQGFKIYVEPYNQNKIIIDQPELIFLTAVQTKNGQFMVAVRDNQGNASFIFYNYVSGTSLKSYTKSTEGAFDDIYRIKVVDTNEKSFIALIKLEGKPMLCTLNYDENSFTNMIMNIVYNKNFTFDMKFSLIYNENTNFHFSVANTLYTIKQ